MASITYRPEIDGLRAVAVIPVILFHSGARWIEGGYLGVDVFFVISGFLITTIILKESDEGRFTFKRFWGRRVRRIFPPLLAMLIATSVACGFLSFKGDLRELGLQGAAAALSCANIAIWQISGNYWGADANESPFLHTWSLSVEEQFYLLHPFIIVLIIKFARRRILGALALITVCSFLLYLFGSHTKPVATFYLLPTRAWELACGCFLAAWVRDRPGILPGRVSATLALAGLVAVISSFFLFSAERSFAGYLAVPVIGSVLLIAFSGGSGFVGKLLSLPAAVFVGKISYSLYLWHWPVIVLGSRLRPPPGWGSLMPLLLLATFVISVLSYKFIEIPTRHAPFGSSPLRLCVASFFASLAISFNMYTGENSYDYSRYSPVVWEGNSYSVCPVDAWGTWDATLREGIVAPAWDVRNADAFATGGIIKRYGGGTPDVVVLGDSHALMWAGTIDRVAAELGVTVAFYAAYATSPFVDIPLRETSGTRFFSREQKYVFDKKRLECIAAWKPKVVVVSARWSNYLDRPHDDLFAFIGRVGAEAILIESPPPLNIGNKNFLQYLAYLGLDPEHGRRQYLEAAQGPGYELGREMIRGIRLRYPFCRVIETGDIFRSGKGEVWALDGSKPLYIDDDHLSQSGAEKVQQKIREALRLAVCPAEEKVRHSQVVEK